MQKGSHMWTWSISAVLSCGPRLMDCWTVSKWKSVRWSDETKMDILVGNHGCRVLRAKEEGDLSAYYQHSVQKPASLMVWGCIRYGQLACFGRHYECWQVYKGFRATYASLQTTSISAGQCILQLLQQHGFIVEESGQGWVSFKHFRYRYLEINTGIWKKLFSIPILLNQF